MDSNTKGNFLEDAVVSVEKMILTEIHSERINDIEVVKRKIIDHCGVTYEIDIYAKVNLKQGYDQIFIFECKNWDAVSIPPKEIYYFDRKIEVTGAQKGFFIGTQFTKSATAMGELLSRVEIVEVTKTQGETSPFVMFSVNLDESKLKQLKFYTSNNKVIDINDIIEEQIIYNGKSKSKEFLQNQMVQKLMKKVDSGCKLRHLETYCEDVSDLIPISDIALMLNGEFISTAFVEAKVCLNISGNKDVQFDVKIGNRGRYTVMTKEAKGTCDIGFTMTITQTD